MDMMINNEVMKKKTSRGRQKIAIKKIEKKTSLQTSFSKRKQGLFNKAAELSVLCGANVAVLVKSPAGRKVVAFGSPSPNYVFDRFLFPGLYPNNVVNFTSNGEVMQLIERNKELEAERDAIEAGGCGGIGPYWWEADVDGLGLCELEKFASELEILHSKVMERAHHMAEMEGYCTSFC